jgi:WD40 repeat protein
LANLNNGNLVSASSDNTIKLWDSDLGTLIGTLPGHSNSVNSLAVLRSGYLVGNKNS